MNLYPKALLILCLSSTAFASKGFDDSCANPFEGITQAFILQELVVSGTPPKSLPLRIANADNTQYEDIGSTSYYLQSRCKEGINQIDLWYGLSQDTPLSRTQLIDNEPGRFKITSECEETQNSFILDTNTKTLSQTGIELSYSVYDTNQNPLLYVFKDEDSETDISFRAYNGTILASANKNFIEQNSSLSYANWVVNNTGADPTTLAYILAWKDATSTNCWYTPDEWLEAKIATAGALLTTSVGLIFCCLYVRPKTQSSHYASLYNGISDENL